MTAGRTIRTGGGTAFALLAAATLVMFGGCSSTGTDSGLGLVGPDGKHPANWVSAHPSYARPDGGECTRCHGEDFRGGISKVSCFSASLDGQSCHSGGPAFHPGNWLNKAGEGTNEFHGTAFRNGVQINNLDCTGCHDLDETCMICHFGEEGERVPPGSSWEHGEIAGHHDTTNLANQSVCINCHETNNGFGFEPFCHNCHGEFPDFHPATWSDPEEHGAAAKRPPSATAGFPYCQKCHGEDFGGIESVPSCINNASCHGSTGVPDATGNALSPHPPRPWRSVSVSHTGTSSATQTAAVCGQCHRNRANAYQVPDPVPPYPGDAVAAGCFNSTLCHGVVGHEDEPNWIDPLPGNHGTVGKNDLTVCQQCHADPPSGGTNPRFNVAVGSLFEGCEDCHGQDTAHPPANLSGFGSPWYAHNTAGNLENACTLCHGATLQGGAGPACTDCHGVSPVNVAQECSSCHGDPPNGGPPVGNIYPNLAGAHGPHNTLAKVTGQCAVCHQGFGSPTPSHYDRSRKPRSEPANVLLDNTTYKATTAASVSYDNATFSCAGVSCHGGNATPNWRTGHITVNFDPGDATDGCRRCHTIGSGEYNAPVSGRHASHDAEGALCTECHDMENGTDGANGHFGTLDTLTRNGLADQTVEPNGNPAFYNASQQTCGTFTCHGQEHSDFPWVGDAANHPVTPTDPPFLGSRHLAATPATFGSDCDACHGLRTTDASGMPSAPTCQNCHSNLPNSNPLTTKNCSSCHGDPNQTVAALYGQPNGALYPNVAGKHPVHLGLNATNTPVSCSTCHTNLGSGTTPHYSRAKPPLSQPGDVAFTGYAAQNDTRTEDFLPAQFTCANFSCHGGAVTPSWRTSANNAIDPGQDCNQCHKTNQLLDPVPGPAQYNDYRSGVHFENNHEGFDCTQCHSPTPLRNQALHFGDLNNTTFPPGAAIQTIDPTLLPIQDGMCAGGIAGGGGCHG